MVLDDVARTSTGEEIICELVDRMYTNNVLPHRNAQRFRLVARVGTTCETMLKGKHKLQFYNIHAGDVLHLVHLPICSGKMAPVAEDETSRSRSRSPVADPDADQHI